MSAIDDVLKNNVQYVEAFGEGGSLHGAPARGLAVVACMDARLDVYRVLGLEEGDAHVIRNAGGVVSDDAIRSLVISQRFLGTREIMLIHHSDCGMMTFRDDAAKDEIEAETGLRPSFALEAFGDLDQDVRQSIARIKARPLRALEGPSSRLCLRLRDRGAQRGRSRLTVSGTWLWGTTSPCANTLPVGQPDAQL